LVSEADLDDQNKDETSRSSQLSQGGQYATVGKPPLKDAQVRKAGGFMIVLGILASKFFIFDKLNQLQTAHEAAIQYSTKMVMIAPVLLIFGLALCIGGYKVLQAVKDNRKKGSKKYLFLLVLLIPAFATQFWFESELSKMGYRDLP
jgi:UDP-N-acetylmuramyl pentapeptide phosphotransferase/UDP-N-acetylglucosamine-1-phosphate transferase